MISFTLKKSSGNTMKIQWNPYIKFFLKNLQNGKLKDCIRTRRYIILYIYNRGNTLPI